MKKEKYHHLIISEEYKCVFGGGLKYKNCFVLKFKDGDDTVEERFKKAIFDYFGIEVQSFFPDIFFKDKCFLYCLEREDIFLSVKLKNMEGKYRFRIESMNLY